jgi:hypothetical protein
VSAKRKSLLLRTTTAAATIAMSGLFVALPANAQSPSPTQLPLSIKDVPPEMVISGVLPDLPEGYMIVEGDIQIRIEEFVRRYQARESTNRPESPNSGYENRLWPNGVVPYEFDANVSANNQTLMQQAMELWRTISNNPVSNVQFVQCANNSCTGDFVHIQSSTDRNNSPVGRRGGRQVINIVSWNSQVVMAHELGHTLGLVHEQSRSDRTTGGFIQINYNNVCKAGDVSCTGGFCFDNNNNRIDCDFNFDIESNALTYGPYDFASIMHYTRNAFSRNGNDTITVLPPYNTQWQNVIGIATQLSNTDRNTMGCMYPRGDWRWVSSAASSPFNGTCRQPYSSLAVGVNNTPSGGILLIEPGSYAAAGTYAKPMTLRAPNGSITLR